MKVIAIIINIFLPGIGTIIIGKLLQGIIQIALSIIAILISFTVVGLIIGIPLYLIAWIWAILSVVATSGKSQRR